MRTEESIAQRLEVFFARNHAAFVDDRRDRYLLHADQLDIGITDNCYGNRNRRRFDDCVGEMRVVVEELKRAWIAGVVRVNRPVVPVDNQLEIMRARIAETADDGGIAIYFDLRRVYVEEIR